MVLLPMQGFNQKQQYEILIYAAEQQCFIFSTKNFECGRLPSKHTTKTMQTMPDVQWLLFVKYIGKTVCGNSLRITLFTKKCSGSKTAGQNVFHTDKAPTEKAKLYAQKLDVFFFFSCWIIRKYYQILKCFMKRYAFCYRKSCWKFI